MILGSLPSPIVNIFSGIAGIIRGRLVFARSRFRLFRSGSMSEQNQRRQRST